MKFFILVLGISGSFHLIATNQTSCKPQKNLLLAASVFVAIGTPALIKTWHIITQMPHDPLQTETYCNVGARKWFFFATVPITLGEILGFVDFIQTYKQGASCPMSVPHYLAADVLTASFMVKLLSLCAIFHSIARCRFEDMPWIAYAEGAPLLGMLLGFIGVGLD